MQFDLLLINILAEVIVSLVDEGLLQHLKPGGRFIAAGIVEDQHQMSWRQSSHMGQSSSSVGSKKTG